MRAKPMSFDRRKFLAASTASGFVAAAGLSTALAEEKKLAPAADTSKKPHRVNRIGVSTYSFWRFKDDSKLPIEECIDQAAEMGFDGVELLHIQMESEENGYLQKLKRRALVNGLDLCGFSIHQGF